jgi:6-phosphofructokinase
MKTLAILTNGGDTCALNASIKSIRDNAYHAGYKKIYGIRRGYQGLVDGWIEDITHKEIDPRIGGSCLGSLRVSPTDKEMEKVLFFSLPSKCETELDQGNPPEELVTELAANQVKVDGAESIKITTVKPGASWEAKILGSETLYIIKKENSLSVKRKQYTINEDRCKKMAARLKDYRIDVLVVIGGDGTLQATKMFQDWVNQQKIFREFREFEIIGFLKTIDNDIRTFTTFRGVEMSLCPGYPSAVKKIVSCVEDLRVTARTAERAFSVETMGRDAGWLAAAATFGGAEILLVPEQMELWEKLNKDNKQLKGLGKQKHILHTLVDEIANFYTKNRNVLIAVAEGFEPLVPFEEVEKFNQMIKDLYGPRKKVGATELITLLVSPILELYFQGYSDFQRQARDLHSFLEETKKSKAYEWYKAKVEDDKKKHPLKGWDVFEKLQAALQRNDENQSSKEDVPTEKRGPSGKGKDRERISPSATPYQFEIRPHRTDYLPRSGPPSAYDYRLATVLGQKVGRMLIEHEYGAVPALDQVVSYDELTLDQIKTVRIDEIRTLNFGSTDYFDEEFPLQVSRRITSFFRTILTGPTDLEEAIQETPTLQARKKPSTAARGLP